MSWHQSWNKNAYFKLISFTVILFNWNSQSRQLFKIYRLSCFLPNVQNTLFVKKYLEFIKNLKNVSLEDGEILNPFDVHSLFLSEPIPQSLECLEDLLWNNSVSDNKIKEYEDGPKSTRLRWHILLKKSYYSGNYES